MNDLAGIRVIGPAAEPAPYRHGAPAIGPAIVSAAFACLLAVLVLGALAPPAAAQTDPRNPDAIALPEIGRMNGTLKCVTAMDESFGRQIYPIGDVNNDGIADWILTHRRCDTSFGGYAVIELLLYHGVRGGLPPTSAGMRIGPSEINADCSFIGAGDYDSDGHRDLVVSLSILGDPLNDRRLISSVVVFWNDGFGTFSTDDTTHLTAPNERLPIMAPDQELWARAPVSCDFNGDAVDDLVLLTKGGQYVDGVRRPYPCILIYRGNRGGARWGRDGVPAEPAWRLWQRYFTSRVSVLDHDGDGALDVVMYVDSNSIGYRGGISICYGRRGALPDTVAETVRFARLGADDPKQGELIDLTGDRVPELVVSTGDSATGESNCWFVFVGRRGTRLLEQYGSGHDPPRPDDSIWWGRPWTIIHTPSFLSSSWSNPFHPVHGAGDIGLDGVDDFCAGSYPTLVCYNGGSRLDSWIDAELPVWPAEGHRARLMRIDDVHGSGQSALAVSLSGEGVAFFGPSRSVPRTGASIRLPEGTDRPASRVSEPSTRPIGASLSPNPARLATRLRWHNAAGPVAVTLLDLQGRDLRHWIVPAATSSLTLDLAGMPAGLYFLRVTSGNRATTLPLIHTD